MCSGAMPEFKQGVMTQRECLQMDLLAREVSQQSGRSLSSLVWFGCLWQSGRPGGCSLWCSDSKKFSEGQSSVNSAQLVALPAAVKSGPLKQSQLLLPVVGCGLFVQGEEWQHQMSRIIEEKSIATAQPCHLVTM